MKPTVGRCVYLFLGPDQIQPLDAHICFVHSDTMINVAYFTEIGEPRAMTSVPLWNGESEAPQYPRCEWMPYQRAQAQGAK